MAKSEKSATTDVGSRVSKEVDYIFSRRHGNSLKVYLNVEQGSVITDEKVAKMLGLTDTEFLKEKTRAFNELKRLLAATRRC